MTSDKKTARSGKRGPKPARRHGPQAETVKIEGSWQKAVQKALKKPRPEKGWPKG